MGKTDANLETRRTGLSLGLLMALACLVVLSQMVSVVTAPPAPEPGQEAPSFVGTTTEGASLASAALRGQVVLLDFWATWCGPCVAALPHLEALRQEFADDRFRVLGINQEPDSKNRVRRFLRRRAVGFPSVFDEGGAIARRYGVHTFPTSFLLDPKGRVLRVYRGYVSPDRLRRDVEDALALGKEAGPQE
ncbi:MAG: TlpA family protein disulfide reductase [Myxococcota bacterium]